MGVDFQTPEQMYTLKIEDKNKEPQAAAWGSDKDGWRRPTLPHLLRCSTIGSGDLDFRVRDGNGSAFSDMVTNQIVNLKSKETAFSYFSHNVKIKGQAFRAISTGLLVTYITSTSCLSTKSSSSALLGMLILRGASHLDAFSGYPLHTWLPGIAAGATTGTPEVCPSRSSRTKDSSSQHSYAHSR